MSNLCCTYRVARHPSQSLTPGTSPAMYLHVIVMWMQMRKCDRGSEWKGVNVMELNGREINKMERYDDSELELTQKDQKGKWGDKNWLSVSVAGCLLASKSTGGAEKAFIDTNKVSFCAYHHKWLNTLQKNNESAEKVRWVRQQSSSLSWNNSRQHTRRMFPLVTMKINTAIMSSHPEK